MEISCEYKFEQFDSKSNLFSRFNNIYENDLISRQYVGLPRFALTSYGFEGHIIFKSYIKRIVETL